MLKRLLVSAALTVLAVAPVSAQATIFNALGGPVTFQFGSASGNSGPGVLIPFQIFLEAVNGNPRRELFNETGTTYSINGGAFVANTTPASSFSLGSFPAGADIIISYVSGGVTYDHVGLFVDQGTSYHAQYFTSALSPSQGSISFDLTNIQSLENADCLVVAHPGQFCVDTPADFPTTSTPEPGTIALMATGLAGLAFVRRKRRTA